MRQTTPAAWLARTVVPMMLATVMLSGQGTSKPATSPQTPQPVFTKTVNYHNTMVRPRDAKGVFVPNLTKDDFEVYEDGVLQKIEVFYPTIGGRPMNAPLVSTQNTSTGGLILPKTRAQTDTSGRVFVILVDDMAILGQDSILARRVMEQVRDHLVQENDLVGIVSSGYSSIEVDLTYDYNHVRLNEAINKTMGSGMTPDEIIKANQTSEGPAGLRYMAHTAMKTANGILERAAQMTDRKKAFIYISSGYDFSPFKDSRLKYQQELYGTSSGSTADGSSNNSNAGTTTSGEPIDPNSYADPFAKAGNQFAEADLVADLAELIRNANRANMTIYTIDPRGLIAGPSIGGTALTSTEWNDYIRTTVDSLIALGDNTGGFCICNTNDYLKGLERINNETSDYYTIGYNSTNPDPFKFVRKVEVRSKKLGLTLDYLHEYTLPRPKKKK
jgi:VWFA-related protein